MYTDRNLNNHFSGVKKPQLNLSNVVSKNATFENTLVENKLQTNGNVTFKSSLSVNNNISTVVGDIISAGSVQATNNISTVVGDITSAGSVLATNNLRAGKYITSGVVTVPLYNTGGGSVAYNPLNSTADVFVDSTKGNIFIITAPEGSSLSTFFLYFNTSAEVPGNIAPVNGTILNVLFSNLTTRQVTVNLNAGPIVKVTSETLVIPAGNRSNIIFTGYSNIITEMCRSGSMLIEST
jgi:hypothetical protein